VTDAAERVARTDDLRPIPVHGSDELARLTRPSTRCCVGSPITGPAGSVGLRRGPRAAYAADVVAHNVELLMASMRPGAPRLPDEEMAGLHRT